MTNFATALKTSEPVAFGGFSELHIIDGKAVKVLSDGCYEDTLQECLMQKQAADAGLAPQIHNVFRMDNDVVVVMDAIDTNKFKHSEEDNDELVPTLIGELNDVEMVKAVKLYAKLLRANVLHGDFHTGNFFFGPNDQSIAIDFGIASQLSTAGFKHLQRAAQFLLPCLDRLDMISEQNMLLASINDADDLRTLLPRIAKSLLAL